MSRILVERLQRCVWPAWCGSVLLKRPFPPVAPVHLTQLLTVLLVQMLRARIEIASIFPYCHSLSGNLSDPRAQKMSQCSYFFHSSTANIKSNCFCLKFSKLLAMSWGDSMLKWNQCDKYIRIYSRFLGSFFSGNWVGILMTICAHVVDFGRQQFIFKRDCICIWDDHAMFSSRWIVTLNFVGIGWVSLKIDGYAADDPNWSPNSKASHIFMLWKYRHYVFTVALLLSPYFYSQLPTATDIGRPVYLVVLPYLCHW